jgi:hypothetical protein
MVNIESVLTNTSISWKAKGLFIFILNHPEVFKEIRTKKDEFLLEHGKEGPDALRSGLKELRQNNFLHSEFHRNTESGRNYIIGTTWTLLGEK